MTHSFPALRSSELTPRPWACAFPAGSPWRGWCWSSSARRAYPMKTRVRITTKENERTMTSDDQELTLRVVPAPGDINTNGHIFGGRVLSQMDIAGRSEERRVGKECVSTGRSRG